MTKIYSVEEVTVSLEKSDPPNLVVSAKGTVNTGGWENFRLEAEVYVQPPADGVLVLHFMADKPTGIVPQAFVSNNEASYREDGVDPSSYWGKGLPLNGVRVVASTNEKDNIFI